MHITHPNKQVSLSRNTFDAFNDWLRANSYSKVFFLVDENTHEYCLIRLLSDLPDLADYEVLEIEAGEESKCHEVLINLYHALAELGADRKSLLVNVGGGVVSDLGGFLAATFKRGIDFINFPTSLLAMVDASVGGKTGINLGVLKNEVGAFAAAKHTYINPVFLETLPKEQLRSGFAEMLKHALIADAEYVRQLSEKLPNALAISDQELERSVEIKSEIVQADFKEGGVRKKLNFGHSIGHALEALHMQMGEPILHGEAVAQGMLVELYLSHKKAGLTKESFLQVRNIICSVFGISPMGFEQKAILEMLGHDKKNEAGRFKFCLLNAIGSAEVDIDITEQEVVDALENYNTYN